MKRINVLTSLVMMSILLSIPQALQSVNANPATGTLFGTDASFGDLITVNPGTGAGAVVNLIDQTFFSSTFPSLAVDPISGTMYGGSGASFDELWLIDSNPVSPTFGEGTLLGSTGLGFSPIPALDFDAAGTLYASVNIAGGPGTGGDHLAILDPINLSAVIVGPFGFCQDFDVAGNPIPFDASLPSDGSGECDIEGIEGIAFDAAGNLFGVKSQRGGQFSSLGQAAPGLYSINLATGAATNHLALLDANQNPASGGFVSLQFACDGTLYGGTATGFQGGNDGGFLATINPVTGAFVFPGAASATGGPSLGGLAFDTVCPVDPGPTEVGGEILSINIASLLVAGMQTGFAWILPLVLSAVGIGALVIRKITRD